ncbi:MAG: beta-L-arabinofuranosidase domain-containing protein [Tepidisphaeraceae bacterium]
MKPTWILKTLGTVMMTTTFVAAADKVQLVARPFDLADVRLLPSRFEENARRAEAYLLSLNADRLLSGFRTEAGLKPKAEKYPGWESGGVCGCVAGHHLSGCSLAFQSTGDNRFRDRVHYMIGELAECQNANGDGYVSAIPDGKRIFAEVAKGEIRSKGFDLNGGWVPWYTTHKVMAGLRDSWLYCGDSQAKEVLVKLADWVDREVQGLSDAQMQKMLLCEQGGMTEVLADVAAITGDAKYLKLSERFNHHAVIDPLAAGEDRLSGLHANTQIPKIVGAAREYELSGDETFRQVAETFWNAVVYHHSYVTGGNSDGEHFGPPDVLSTFLSDNTTETCNTYNMLKLTRHLFSWTGDARYFDFYERALVNHILGSQNPSTGEVTYYVPLRSGAKRQWQSLTNSFTCCVGTGMENHVKYGDSIYFHNDKDLWVNLFIASELDWSDKGVTVRMDSPFPRPGEETLTINAKRPTSFTLKLRRPFWATDFAVSVNGEPVKISAQPSSYVDIDRQWKTGDRVRINAPYRLRTESQPDKANEIAIFDGPVLLAEKIAVPQDRKTVLVDDSSELLQSIQPAGEQLEFKSTGVGRPQDFELAPFYDAWKDHYAVYFDRFTKAEWKQVQSKYEAEQARQRALEKQTIDFLAIGEMQPERDHNVTGENTRVGEGMEGRKWRDADGNGWFEFTLKVDPKVQNNLLCTYWGGETVKRSFEISVNGKPLAHQVLANDRPGEFFDVSYPLPRELTEAGGTVRIRFYSSEHSTVGGCFGARMIRVSQ